MREVLLFVQARLDVVRACKSELLGRVVGVRKVYRDCHLAFPLTLWWSQIAISQDKSWEMWA